MAELTDAGNTFIDTGVNQDEQAVYDSIRDVLERARRHAAAAVNSEMVLAYWEVGRRIHEAVGDRSEYGKHLVEYLSERLTAEFGKAYSTRMLWQMRQFFCAYPIVNALRSQLSWTHYRTLMRIGDPEGAPDVPTASSLDIRDPYVLDFLGLPDSALLHESDLEQAIIDHLQDFMVELGAGFSFVGRQVRVSSELSEYYVDLVFYHVRLKCYVLVDLKAGKLDPRDVGCLITGA